MFFILNKSSDEQEVMEQIFTVTPASFIESNVICSPLSNQKEAVFSLSSNIEFCCKNAQSSLKAFDKMKAKT